MTELQPLSPQEAKDWYLEDRRADVADATHRAHKYRLSAFVRWCDEAEIENMNNLSGRRFHKYKTWRREEGDCNKVTLATQLSTLKVFIDFCEGIDAVSKNLSEYIDPPTMSKQEDVNDDHLDAETAEVIINYSRKYDYASRNHLIFEMLWHTGMRSGALRAMDLPDYDRENRSIEVLHRPDEDTPIKNKNEGQRIVSLKPKVNDILSDYIDHNRIKKMDEHGRKPLITTRQGRLAKGTVRTACYQKTLPCQYGMECPHGRDPEGCEALETYNAASKCPSSHASHLLRKGAITHARRKDIPLEAVSERMDVSAEILKKHYDKRTKEEEMKTRRGYFDNV